MKEPIPALNAFFKSFLANMISKIVAPNIGPRNIPTKLPSINPTIPPTIAPTIPQLDPPNFFAPNATTMLSTNVERRERMKRTTNIEGDMTSKLSRAESSNTPIYTNQTPGRVNTVSTMPARKSIPTNTYINISIVIYFTLLYSF